MNNLLRASFIAALMLILSGCLERTSAQKCAGDISYVIRNGQGEIIDAEKVELKYLRRFTMRGRESFLGFKAPTYAREHDSLKMLKFQTRCGLDLAEVKLKYEGHNMLLRFHNIPQEMNFVVDSVPFGEGTYEINFKNRWAETIEGVTLNREGLRSNGEKSLLGSIAEAGLLVSSENWRKTSPLVELRSKRRVHLVATTRPVNVIDARQAQDEAVYTRAVIADALNKDAGKMRHIPDAYKDLADQLRKYARRYRSLDLVERPEDADLLLIFYEVSRFRRSESFFGINSTTSHSLGLLLVVTMGSPEEPEPRIVLHTEEPQFPEYLIKNFIHELKVARGQK